MGLELIPSVICFIKTKVKRENEIIHIRFHGGEPLLNIKFIKSFIKMMEDNKFKNKIVYYLTTNGTLLTNETMNFIKEKEKNCSISIDGIPEVHNANRVMKNGKGSWEYIRENLVVALEEIPYITARVTYTSKTAKYMLETARYLVAQGFKEIEILPDYFDEEWSEELVKQLKEVLKEIKEYNNQNDLVQISTGNYSKDNLSFCNGCVGGIENFVIDINGNVYPCSYIVNYQQFCLGNIEDIGGICSGRPGIDHSKRVACRECCYFKFCMSGRCTYVNYRITGDIYEPGGFFCAYQKIEYELSGL